MFINLPVTLLRVHAAMRKFVVAALFLLFMILTTPRMQLLFHNRKIRAYSGCAAGPFAVTLGGMRTAVTS